MGRSNSARLSLGGAYFSHSFFFLLKNCHLPLEQCLNSKWWICWTVVYPCLLLNKTLNAQKSQLIELYSLLNEQKHFCPPWHKYFSLHYFPLIFMALCYIIVFHFCLRWIEAFIIICFLILQRCVIVDEHIKSGSTS